MDFAPTEEQEALVASFAALLARSSTPERVRAAEVAGGVDADLWRTLLDTGAVTMAVPEAQGGWGASLLDLALVAEQLGRAAAPAPVVEAQVAARALGRDPGDRLVTFAPRPGGTGLVPAGAVCDAVVLLAGRELRLAPVLARTPVDNLAASPLADLELGEGEVVGDAEAFETALDEWLVLTAATVVGCGSAALDLGCAYAAERVAFGRPIGSFQAIAHPFADDATALDGARLLVQKAAWELDRGGPRGRELAAMAFAFAARSAEKATYDALHAHGGYGFMLEYDVQLHWRRARGWPRVWGDATAADHRAATARYRRER